MQITKTPCERTVPELCGPGCDPSPEETTMRLVTVPSSCRLSRQLLNVKTVLSWGQKGWPLRARWKGALCLEGRAGPAHVLLERLDRQHSSQVTSCVLPALCVYVMDLRAVLVPCPLWMQQDREGNGLCYLPPLLWYSGTQALSPQSP